MKKKLYKAAYISSPILAVLTTTPAYFVNNLEFTLAFRLWIIVMLFILLIWQFNIFVAFKFENPSNNKRYFLSYAFVLLLQSINIFVINANNLVNRTAPLIFPYIPAIAINTIIILMANAIIFHALKERAELEVEQLKVKNLEAQKLMLLQQIQPHFLFNALSTLKSLIKENPTNAEDYTVRLSHFLRYSVQAKDNEVVKLADELKFTIDYVELQKVRFGSALHCEFDIPADVLNKKVPVYALQTLVENAVKHTAFTDKKPLLIHVSAEGNRIKIVNNRLPKKLMQPSGTGLQNLEQRYQLIAGMGIEVDESDSHFTVYITLI